MLVSAIIRKASHIDKMWGASPHKLAGYVSGVRFEKRGGEFIASDLHPDQVEALRGNSSVRIEMIGVAPLAIAAERPTDTALAPPTVAQPPAAAPEKRGPGRPRRN